MNPKISLIHAVGTLLAETSSAARGAYYGEPEVHPNSRRQRLHHTKPFESLDEARVRKKTERQRKKKARNQRKR